MRLAGTGGSVCGECAADGRLPQAGALTLRRLDTSPYSPAQQALAMLPLQQPRNRWMDSRLSKPAQVRPPIHPASARSGGRNIGRLVVGALRYARAVRRAVRGSARKMCGGMCGDLEDVLLREASGHEKTLTE